MKSAIQLEPPPHANLLHFHHHKFPARTRQLHLYRRRRHKSAARTLVLCAGLLDPFQSFLTQFPSSNSLDLLAPAIGLASGLTLYLAGRKSRDKSPEVGEWILFTSPTPFNRFVILRCPSVSFEGSELLEGVNEKLVEQDRHFVRLNSGRIQGTFGEEDAGSGGSLVDKLEYQRVCVSAEDGGVVSIDWPSNLDLEEERGLDTTFLLVPGTPDGSMDPSVRSFVCESLGRGFFPIVMNPRGCAGSPLTTARLFSAADSDDISTVVHFITKARPWTTIMAVGWGYGASMLTKYLGEVGDRTPITAATCINNPFDLDEATRCSPYHVALDEKLTGGLVDILRANKGLFQGKAKGFNVEKALLAKSVRDFEKAISMVSYGFKEIEEFYSKSSTSGLVKHVKIPVLFIQNLINCNFTKYQNDGAVPPFSIPRSSIAENPCTNLLLCSCSPHVTKVNNRAAQLWCQNLTLEWLTAVELGLLKGRHPLLDDLDVTVNLSTGLSRRERAIVDIHGENKELLDLTVTDTNGYAVSLSNQLPDGSSTSDGLNSGSILHYDKDMEIEDGLQGEEGQVRQRTTVETDLMEDESAIPLDAERGEVLQTAQVVMKMLDTAMPGALAQDERKKVLSAVGRGETLLKALEGAVPEEVRGKLTAAASGILQANRMKLKLDGLMGSGEGKIPALSSGLKSTTQVEASSDSMSKDIAVDEMNKTNSVTDDVGDNQSGIDQSGGGLDPELLSSDNLQKSVDLGQSQSMTNQHGDIHGPPTMGANESENNHTSDGVTREKAALFAESKDKGLEASLESVPEKAGSVKDATSNDTKLLHDDESSPEPETRKDNNSHEKTTMESSSEQSEVTPSNISEGGSPSAGVPEPQQSGKEGIDDQKRDSISEQPVPIQNKSALPDSNTPTFNVVQALDAFAGIDDSTQVAVNSVFGVIENMIDQFQEDQDNKDHANDGNETEDEFDDSGSSEPLNVDRPSAQAGAGYDGSKARPKMDTLISSGNISSNSGRVVNNYRSEIEKEQLFGIRSTTDLDDSNVRDIPLRVNKHLYEDYLQNAHLNKYLLAKMPKTKPLDVDPTAALLLDYFPEDGQWKLLEQHVNVGQLRKTASTSNVVQRKVKVQLNAEVKKGDDFIEPSYVVLDTETRQQPVGEYKVLDNLKRKAGDVSVKTEELIHSVKHIILDALKVEVGRKLSVADVRKMKPDLGSDIELVADAVSLSVGHGKDHIWNVHDENNKVDYNSERHGVLHAESIVSAISSSVSGTTYLRRLLPVGVIVGCCLAALKKHFDVATGPNNDLEPYDQNESSLENCQDEMNTSKKDLKLADDLGVSSLNHTRSRKGEEAVLKNIDNDSIMVGAVTAALGASAFLGQQDDNEIEETSAKYLKERVSPQIASEKLDGELSEKDQNNIVASFAEKAMSVAGPVVPTKEDGGVDQERLVAMLADLGQKGGILSLVGKLALLWGGLRGAMSLTERLISFLHLADRPLHQRILGFVGMALVLWSPVVIPLLPTLVQSWTSGTPSRFAELVSILGLYAAILMLVIIWGRKLRGHEFPLKQYGLDLTTLSKIQSFFKALAGGMALVLLIQSVNVYLGCVSFSWPARHPSSTNLVVAYLKLYGQMVLFALQGILSAAGVVLVEELFFRSWLPGEIALDLGFHQGIVISGLLYALSQRYCLVSPLAVPALWLLSMALSGLRQRSQGSLSVVIGLRAGIMASSYVLQRGGFLTYKYTLPLWVAGTHPFQPFSGVVGLAVSLLMAVVLYPRRQLHEELEGNS
ncbi:unnamed protein product [Linum tenue]|uniref:Embryogenesis-associated protein EMB8 n=1 Tax=Linum tenue TaxID=586396 RepID=A0AAV0HST8_9ROSI|nr:unnamed protein product [Linum tenue]